jgi:hypothetical protein
MKVQFICEDCNKMVELTPQTRGQHVNVQSVNDYFRTSFEIEYDNSDNLEDSFISLLSEASDKQEVREILENEITENVNVDGKLNELRIDCTNCGNYIVLNNF